jgi:hypothetical protein
MVLVVVGTSVMETMIIMETMVVMVMMTIINDQCSLKLRK